MSDEAVSYENDIRPLFRDKDRERMESSAKDATESRFAIR